MRRSWRLMSALGVFLAATSMAMSAILFKLNSAHTDQVATLTAENTRLARDTARLAGENTKRIRETARLARAIQASRKDALLTTCRETNRRHRRTIKALDREIARAAPERVQQARRSRAATVRLLSAILPTANCAARAKRLVKPQPAP